MTTTPARLGGIDLDRLVATLPPSAVNDLQPAIIAYETAIRDLRSAAFDIFATHAGLRDTPPPTPAPTPTPIPIPAVVPVPAVRMSPSAPTRPTVAPPVGARKPRRFAPSQTTTPGVPCVGMLELRIYDAVCRARVTTQEAIQRGLYGAPSGAVNSRASRGLFVLTHYGLVTKTPPSGTQTSTTYAPAVQKTPLTHVELAGISATYLLIRVANRPLTYVEIRDWYLTTFAGGARKGPRWTQATSRISQILTQDLVDWITKLPNNSFVCRPTEQGLRNIPTVNIAVPSLPTVMTGGQKA